MVAERGMPIQDKQVRERSTSRGRVGASCRVSLTLKHDTSLAPLCSVTLKNKVRHKLDGISRYRMYAGALTMQLQSLENAWTGWLYHAELCRNVLSCVVLKMH